MFRYLLVLSLLLPAGFAAGQGWERVFDGGGIGQINDVAMTPDGGFIMISSYNAVSRAHLLKTDADGMLQWTRDYFLDTQTSGEALVIAKDGGYVIAGFQKAFNSSRKAYVLKTDALGNLVWKTVFPGNGFDAEALDVVELANEDAYIVCGYQKTIDGTEDVLVFKVDGSGSILWSNTFGKPNIQEKGYAIALDQSGNLLVAGERRDGPSGDMYVVHVLSDSGDSDWEKTYGLFNVSGQAANDVARDIQVTADGGFVLAGTSNLVQGGAGVLLKIDGTDNNIAVWQSIFPKADFYGLSMTANGGFLVTGNKASTVAQEELYMARTDAEGVKLCDATIGRPGVDRGYAVVPTPDGGAVSVGSGELFVGPFTEESLYMVKMDKNCLVFTSYIAGNIFHDYNTNCKRDLNEPGLEDWIVRIESPNYTRYAAADDQGNFLMLVDTGTYNIILFPPNDSWKSCDPVTTVQVAAFSDTVSVDIPVLAVSARPRNEVDVATPVLRRCAENTYTIRYCNAGTSSSLDTRVEVTLDEALTLTGSSIPVAQQQGNTYTFNIGFLDNGQCGSFTIDALLDCNTALGETHCVQAHIYPDSLSSSGNWDGSIVEALALCENDTVKMILANVGVGDMGDPVGFVIAEDVVMLTQPGDPLFQVQLDAGKQSTVWTTPATGKTYRIISEQTQGYPGTSYPTAAVERCKSDTSSLVSLGFYTMFPDDEAEPFKASDCQESYETDFNPEFLKRGHPKGYDVAHYVQPQTDLEFLIQFQNSGTDTVHQVIVRDTLSNFLDPSTVHPGAASHPYDFTVYGPGIVQFTLPNSNLIPGSGTNEGFVSFRVAQKSDIPCGTEIRNSAAIYLDYNAPVLSNQTYHTVCEFDSFVVVKTKYIELEGADVKVYPNPFDESALFEVSGVAASGFTLELYDLQGKKLLNQSFNHPTFRLYRQQLPAGMLLYRLITNKGQPVASGKLLVR